MSLIEDVKAICDRLGPLGWRDLFKAVSHDALDIQQTTTTKLKTALTDNLGQIDRTLVGFEDFDTKGQKGITAYNPAQSLLYHAFASPNVVRGANGRVLGGFPTLAELETIENYVFGVAPRDLAKVLKAAGTAHLSIVVYATEYRPAPDTPDRAHADLVFSRTGITRVGTSRALYLPEVRGFWPVDDGNGFRVIPARFTVWLAATVTGAEARVMRLGQPDKEETTRKFLVPVHKLFEGTECLSDAGLDLTFNSSTKFFNEKLKRVRTSVDGTQPTGFPFVIVDAQLAELKERTEFGRLSVVPVVQESLVKPAIINGTALTYQVPIGGKSRFASYEPKPPEPRPDDKGSPYPAYVHARTKIKIVDKQQIEIDLNDFPDVNDQVNAGGYEALHYLDFTGEGWLTVKVPQLAGRHEISAEPRSAYVLLSGPDFFPSTGQFELSRWSQSPQIPGSFRGDQLWGVAPKPLSEVRLPANLQLIDNPFDNDDSMPAVIGMGKAVPGTAALGLPRSDVVRASTLPDDAAGIFAPGWDVSTDTTPTGTTHMAAYALGSPFPEDSKLCAALSTFWPAVAPDVYRTMSLHTGNKQLRGTVAPLTDEEIGQTGALPWDGVPGPKIVQVNGTSFVEMASFLNVDYVINAVENRFSLRLTSQITAEEYERRMLAVARAHFVLSGGMNVWPARTEWLILSFRPVSAGDLELHQAQTQSARTLTGRVYRIEACFTGLGDHPTVDSPRGPRFRLLPLQRQNFFFVSAKDTQALRRREIDSHWTAVAAE